jgi:3-dehydroquinate dehydratase II
MKILVLNGPNLNLLGRREPHIYGSMTLADVQKKLEALAKELKVELVFFQSNHEGELVDMLHKHIDSAAGAILNPGRLTQFGVSLHDAIKSLPFPVIEVHMSNRHAREAWRGHSIISPAAKGTVEGLGWRSYSAALRALIEMLKEK